MRSGLGFVGSIALVLGVLAAAPAEAGSIVLSHGIDVPPRVEATNVALYLRDVARRDLAPEAFDDHHPPIGRILSEPTFYEETLSQWEAHPRGFEHEHRELWRVLDGDMLWHERHGGHTVGLTHQESQDLPGQGLLSGPGSDGAASTISPIKPPRGGEPPAIAPQGQGSGVPSVPEPSTGILMVLGVFATIFAAALHRGQTAG